MPLYEFQCDECGHRFEIIQQKFSDPPPAACPQCGGTVRKLVSSPAFQFKGSGWYATDYAKKSEGPKSPGESTEAKDNATKEAKESKDSKNAKDGASKDSGTKDSGSTDSTSSTSTSAPPSPAPTTKSS
jgi:putative FmdB family regulatory protein